MTIRERNLSGAVKTELAVDFTRPVYLVSLLFPSGTLYLSTGPQITYDSNVYSEGQVSVRTFTWNADGSQTGELALSNESNAASALILNGTVNDIEIIIYKTYLIAGGGNTDPYVYIRGVMDGSEVDAVEAVVGVLSNSSAVTFLPNRYHTIAEGFNWLPISGEKVTWGEEVFILQEEA